MEHRILPTGLHCIQDSQGRVHVYTEQEFQHIEWWMRVKMRFNL